MLFKKKKITRFPIAPTVTVLLSNCMDPTCSCWVSQADCRRTSESCPMGPPKLIGFSRPLQVTERHDSFQTKIPQVLAGSYFSIVVMYIQLEGWWFCYQQMYQLFHFGTSSKSLPTVPKLHTPSSKIQVTQTPYPNKCFH